MKKSVLILLTIALVGVGRPVSAQVIEVGALVGMNASQLYGDVGDIASGSIPGVGSVTANMNEWKQGPIGGVFLGLHLSNFIGLRIEAIAVQKGGQGPISGTVMGSPVDGTITLDITYLEIPILITASWFLKDVTLRLLGGVSYDQRVSAEVELETQGVQQPPEDRIDVDDLVKSTDIGFVLGGEALVSLGWLNVLLDLRWTPGQTNINDGFGIDSPRFKNNTVSFMAGFSLGGT